MKLETTDIFKTLSRINPDLITLTDEEVRQVQDIELSALKDVLSVCNDLDVNYHLTGGSALGAVRHGGFIPWDDDIDLDMARADVKRFLKEFKRRYGDKYWIHTPYSHGNAAVPCINIRRKGTIFQGCVDPSPKECGISLDIAIIENTFDNGFLRFTHGFISLILGFIASCRRFYRNRNYLLKLAGDNEEIKEIFKRKIKIGRLFAFLPLSAWVRLFDKWNGICRNSHSEKVTVPAGRYHFFKEMYLRSKFYETTTAEFEGLTVKVPADTDAYLRHMYGKDYMTVPPKEDREQHTLTRFSLNDQE